MHLRASVRREELRWSRRRAEEGLRGLRATSRRRWNGFTSCADVDRRLRGGLFDALSQVGCYSMRSRFFFFFFLISIQRSGLYICTLAYKFPWSMGLNDKNTITALQGLKELEEGLKGHLSLISSARPKVWGGGGSPAGEVNYHTNPIIRRY